MIYFNQATTSYPKPDEVIDEMVNVMKYIGGSPGRSDGKSQREVSTIVTDTRKKIAKLFQSTDPNKVIFTQNATAALNQAIKGLNWEVGDHIITTTLEHNSVRRPIHFVQESFGVDVTYINPKEEPAIVNSIEQHIKDSTKAIILTHACNVTGDIMPIEEIGKIARDNNVIFIVDGSQSVGHIPISMKDWGLNMLAFPAHKSLLGPQGIGVLLVEGEVKLEPIHHGGTGIYSEEASMPTKWPYRFESGTLNGPAIAGLYAALKLYEKNREDNVSRETILFQKLINGLREIEGVTIYSLFEQKKNIPIVAFNIKDISSQEIAMILDSHYNISVRAGLHCNPLCHETYGTVEQGMVRASINASNNEEEVNIFLRAIKEIANSYDE